MITGRCSLMYGIFRRVDKMYYSPYSVLLQMQIAGLAIGSFDLDFENKI